MSTLILNIICPNCHKNQTIKVNEAEYFKWKAGELIQRAMPKLSDNDRETLLSGLCPECWNKLFQDNTEEESEYNEFGIDIRTGEPFNKPN